LIIRQRRIALTAEITIEVEELRGAHTFAWSSPTLIYLPTLTSVFTLTSTRASEFHQSPCQAVWRCNSVQDESVPKWHNAANPITADDVR